MENLIIQMVESFKELSYFGIILALTLEFVPAELVLPLAGYWVYEGEMNLFGAILAGSIGGVLGPLTLYSMGRYGGRVAILKFGKYFFIKEQYIEKSDQFYEKHGGAVAFLGRFIPGVRTAISITCGIAKMSVWKFIIYTYLAMLPVTAGYVYLGYILGPEWEKAGELFSKYANFLLIPITLFIIWLIVKRRKINVQS